MEALELTLEEIEALLAASITVMLEYDVPDGSHLDAAADKICTFIGVDLDEIVERGEISLAEDEVREYGKLDS